jgi:hypothetical protein
LWRVFKIKFTSAMNTPASKHTHQHVNIFVLGPAVINTHTSHNLKRDGHSARDSAPAAARRRRTRRTWNQPWPYASQMSAGLPSPPFLRFLGCPDPGCPILLFSLFRPGCPRCLILLSPIFCAAPSAQPSFPPFSGLTRLPSPPEVSSVFWAAPADQSSFSPPFQGCPAPTDQSPIFWAAPAAQSSLPPFSVLPRLRNPPFPYFLGCPGCPVLLSSVFWAVPADQSSFSPFFQGCCPGYPVLLSLIFWAAPTVLLSSLLSGLTQPAAQSSCPLFSGMSRLTSPPFLRFLGCPGCLILLSPIFWVVPDAQSSFPPFSGLPLLSSPPFLCFLGCPG